MGMLALAPVICSRFPPIFLQRIAGAFALMHGRRLLRLYRYTRALFQLIWRRMVGWWQNRPSIE
jgi:hypothetical protein